MSGLLRNKHGCWTCRARKKKCDGARPNCSTCESLSITCYRYGLKPEWMDHGQKEKEMIDSFKRTVKQTSRKKPATKSPSDPVQLAKIAPKASHGTPSLASPSSSSYNHSFGPSPGHNSSTDEGTNTLRSGSTPEHTSKDHHDVIMFHISPSESISLMHYLDVVFPLQFPMYRPNLSEGGRGWLLAPLLRLRPLYHATLAVSSLHYRKSCLGGSENYSCSVASLVEQEKHLEICLTEFQQMLASASESIENSVCPNSGLDIITMVVHLIFFEFSGGQGSAWKVHLQAATNMYQRQISGNLLRRILSERARAVLYGDSIRHGDDRPKIWEEVMTYKFSTEAVIWLDILSSITDGKPPRLQLDHLQGTASISPLIKLEEIMGCKNWVMALLGRITVLHDSKSRALEEGCLVGTCLDESMNEISREIQCGLAQMDLENLDFSNESSNTTLASDSMTITKSCTLVTYMFALTASVYLHLVVHGFQKLGLLENITKTAMEMLSNRLPSHLLPAVVCPLYIIGTVAREEEDRTFFRKLLCSPSLANALYEHRARILLALEEVWRRRENIRDLSWCDTLDLVSDLLLL